MPAKVHSALRACYAAQNTIKIKIDTFLSVGISKEEHRQSWNLMPIIHGTGMSVCFDLQTRDSRKIY